MSDDELARLGTELDDVTVAYRKERFPLANDPAERASRRVATLFALSVVLGGFRCCLPVLALGIQAPR